MNSIIGFMKIKTKMKTKTKTKTKTKIKTKTKMKRIANTGNQSSQNDLRTIL